MKLKTISIEYGRVVNLGDYNSLRAHCTLGAEIEDGEDADAALSALWEQARESVRVQVLRVASRKAPALAATEDGSADHANGSPHEVDLEP